MGIFTGRRSCCKEQQNADDAYPKDQIEDGDAYAGNYQDAMRDIYKASNVIAKELANKSTGIMEDFKSIVNEHHSDENDDMFLKDIKNLDRFMNSISGGWFSNPFNINYRPLTDKGTGYWAYPSPSSEIYDACKEKQGLGVWDEQGYWRCLFPRSQIPPEKLGKALTKEDVLEDTNNSKGLFFQDFNKYLDWKSDMKKMLREERQRKYDEWKQRQQQGTWTKNHHRQHRHRDRQQVDRQSDQTQVQPDASAAADVAPIPAESKRITGTKEYVSSFERNGVVEETKKLYEYYDDGSSSVREFSKKYNRDVGAAPEIEEKVQEFPGKKVGWFWDNSDN